MISSLLFLVSAAILAASPVLSDSDTAGTCRDSGDRQTCDRAPSAPPPPGCSDDHRKCAKWAARGECASNSRYMHTVCPLSCGTCPDVDEAEEEGGEEETGGRYAYPPVHPLRPHRAVVGDTEVFYLLPPDLVAGADTRAVLVWFHGCHHSGGADMFLLPEDRRIAHAALSRGVAVLSVTAEDKLKKCWNQEFQKAPNADTDHLDRTITTWIKGVQLPADLPRLGGGASSGGTFLFRVWDVAGFVALAPYITVGGDTLMEERRRNGPHKVPPPAIFSVMAREDPRYLEYARSLLPVTATIVQGKVPFTEEHCRSRLPELEGRSGADGGGAGPCGRFVELLRGRSEPYLGADWHVRRSPTGPQGDVSWQISLNRVLREYPVAAEAPPVGKRRGTVPARDFQGRSWMIGAVEEALASCFAYHETSSDGMEKVLDFLEEHAKI